MLFPFILALKMLIWCRNHIYPQENPPFNYLHISLNNIWDYYRRVSCCSSTMTAKKLKERKVKPGKTNFVYQTWHSGKTSRHNKHISNDWSQDQIKITISGLEINKIIYSSLHTILHSLWKGRKCNNQQNTLSRRKNRNPFSQNMGYLRKQFRTLLSFLMI